ncbi:hypothetical protein LIER_36209 [Lithospermum erythrorhizon]|uniref:Uncharacterized protein n=1 Tax=Lithospermum erythrorhizon TaxID=34254 RepID=A0AAV3P475_LITER
MGRNGTGPARDRAKYRHLEIYAGFTDVRESVPIKDKMSQSTENQPENFELCPRRAANQVEASISGGIPILHPDRPSNPAPQTAPVNPLAITYPEGVRDEAGRAEKAYQGGSEGSIPYAEDMDSVAKLRNALPQGENKLPWYTFYDEAMLVMACLVYDKVFRFDDRGKPIGVYLL